MGETIRWYEYTIEAVRVPYKILFTRVRNKRTAQR